MSTADESRNGKPGDKKRFPKTFGDVMKGVPAGKGSSDRPETPARGPRQGPPAPAKKASPSTTPEGGTSDKRQRERHRSDEVRKGPVIVRKPPPLAAKKEEGEKTAEGASTATAETHKAHDRKPPKTVFRRADGLNLPPREAEGEKALAPTHAAAAPTEPAVEENFAQMFAESEKGAVHQRFEVGGKVTGRIVQIGGDHAFLDLGGKGEGMIDLAELRDTHGNLIVAVGEILEGYVLALAGDHGGIVVTKALSKGAQREFLAEARATGIPVEGLVTGHNKGGLEIDLGGMRGFCPSSQIDTRFVENPAELVGSRQMFKVLEVKDRDIVLSRRAQLEEEAAKKASDLRVTLHVGAQVEGTVVSLRDFGAFVDLGGLEGLIHVSELGYGRVTHPKDALTVGQKVKVEIIRIDQAKDGEKAERIALSMKALQQDPWEQAVASLKEGERVKGKVVRLQPFGAFVEIAPGVDGLIHISALGATKRVMHPKEVVSEGEDVECVVESIDAGQKRIGLRRLTGEESAMPPQVKGEQAATAAPKVGDVFDVTVDKVETFGIFVKWPSGRGLVPNSEMGTVKGTDHRKQFPRGASFKAVIAEIDNQGRIKLSRSSAERHQEQAEYQQFLKQQHKPSGKGFGTFGDLFKLKK